MKVYPKVRGLKGRKRALYFDDIPVPLNRMYDLFTHSYASRMLTEKSWSQVLFLNDLPVSVRFESIEKETK